MSLMGIVLKLETYEYYNRLSCKHFITPPSPPYIYSNFCLDYAPILDDLELRNYRKLSYEQVGTGEWTHTIQNRQINCLNQ